MARYPSGKGEVCKTFMRRFDPDPRLHSPCILGDFLFQGKVDMQVQGSMPLAYEIHFNKRMIPISAGLRCALTFVRAAISLRFCL